MPVHNLGGLPGRATAVDTAFGHGVQSMFAGGAEERQTPRPTQFRWCRRVSRSASPSYHAAAWALPARPEEPPRKLGEVHVAGTIDRAISVRAVRRQVRRRSANACLDPVSYDQPGQRQAARPRAAPALHVERPGVPGDLPQRDRARRHAPNRDRPGAPSSFLSTNPKASNPCVTCRYESSMDSMLEGWTTRPRRRSQATG